MFTDLMQLDEVNRLGTNCSQADSLHQAGKIHNLHQVCGVSGCVCSGIPSMPPRRGICPYKWGGLTLYLGKSIWRDRLSGGFTPSASRVIYQGGTIKLCSPVFQRTRFTTCLSAVFGSDYCMYPTFPGISW